MQLRTVFFCGNNSRYGRAHLEPVLGSELGTTAVVVATDARWEHFRRQLHGEQYLSSSHAMVRRELAELALAAEWQVLVRECKQMVGKQLIRMCEQAAQRILPSESTGSFGPAPVEQVVAEAGKSTAIEMLVADDVNSDEFIKRLRAQAPDLFITAAYPQIFSQELLAVPRLGAINFHPSLLPEFRGAHPHFWAIRRGADKSGLTAHFMTDEIDRGEIVAQIEFPIAEKTYSQVYEEMVAHTPALVEEVQDFVLSGADPAPIPENREGSYFRNDRQVHRRIFWGLHDAEDVRNLIRTEKAFCFFRNLHLMPRDAEICSKNRNLTNEVEVEPGTIVDIDAGRVTVKARSGGYVSFSTVVSATGFRPALEWARIFGVRIGERFC